MSDTNKAVVADLRLTATGAGAAGICTVTIVFAASPPEALDCACALETARQSPMQNANTVLFMALSPI
jgi:hypothetical protein